MPKARIIGTGSYLPKGVLTNADLEKKVDTSDEWITTRTGVKERRIANDQEFSSNMGAAAAKIALEKANVDKDSIDLILVATATPDYIFPCTAAVIQDLMGIPNAGAVDLEAACTGHIYALATAKAYIESGIFQNILVIASEKFSTIVNYKDRNTCVLFGDGASAAVVSGNGPGFLLGEVVLGSDGSHGECLLVPAGGCREPATVESAGSDRHTIFMQGREVFKQAVRRMVGAATECLEKEGVQTDEVQWIVPHQANVRIIESVAKRLKVPEERVYNKCVEKYGNNSAASVAIAMDELTQEEEINVGERLLLVAFGAGMTFGAILLTKIEETN